MPERSHRPGANTRVRRAVIVLLTLACAGSPWASTLRAQTSNYYNPKDDQYRLLGLKRAKQAYEYARAEFERKQALFDRNLVSQLELDQARNLFSDAEVNYQQALLAVLFEKQYVAIKKAVKRQLDDGRKEVRITLENPSRGGAEFEKLINIEDELFKSLQPDVVNDVYVSILNDDGAIIGQPYEIKIEALRYGQPREVRFTLLQDLDAVSVNLIYGSGSQSSRKIYLQKDITVNKVIVQAEQFSQEVELGNTASYGLSLELFSGQENTFKLEVVNLPAQIDRYFVDPTTQARLSQFKFTESANTRRAALQISLPDRPGEDVPIDKPISFYVLAVPKNVLPRATAEGERLMRPEEIAALGVGFARLELVPRGVGKLLVKAPQLYYAVHAGQPVECAIDLVNDGTRRLDNVLVTADPPLQWIKSIAPEVVQSLQIGEEKRVLIRVAPPAGVMAGRYEVRVRTSSLSDNRPIAGEDKTITVEILPRANLIGTTLIVLAILGLVGGIVFFGIRLSRR